jgi:DNA-binding response OmpR family regulator
VTAAPASVRVLVVEDDGPLRLLLRRTLEPAGYTVVEAADGAEAMAAIDRTPAGDRDGGAAVAPGPAAPAGAEIDLVILDLYLPKVSGIEVLKTLRRHSRVPVIILSGRSNEADRVLGLEAGADDYVVKPFFPRELLARVRAVLRRVEPVAAPAAAQPTDDGAPLVFDELVIDRRGREVVVAGERVAVTAREFDLLAYLAAAPRQVFSREQLLNAVWRSSSEWQDPATVTELVRRLRLKIEARPDRPRWLQTVRGAGYRFDP